MAALLKKQELTAAQSYTIEDLSKMGVNISKILKQIAPSRFNRSNIMSASGSHLSCSNMSKTMTPRFNNMESLVKEVTTAT